MSEKKILNSKKILIILYIIGLIAGYFFVQKSLKIESVDVITRAQEETKIEAKPVSVFLNIKNGKNTTKKTYNLKDTETIYDLLQLSRKQKDTYFETTEYFDHTDIKFFDSVDYINETRGTILLDGEDITDKIRETKLIDKTEYTLRLVTY